MQGQGRAMQAWAQRHGPLWLSLASTYPTVAVLAAALRSLKLLPILVLLALREAAYGRHTFCGEWVYLAEGEGRRRAQLPGTQKDGGKLCSLRQTGQKQGPGEGCVQIAGGHGFFWQRIEPSWMRDHSVTWTSTSSSNQTALQSWQVPC